MSLRLRNPHSVLAALQTRPDAVIDIRLYSHKPSGAWREVMQMASPHRIPVLRGVSRRETGRRNRRDQTDQTGRSGAGEATVRERDGVLPDVLFADVSEQAQGRGLWLALDQIQDPHNIGAIFRSAAFFGIRGILLTRDRSAPLSATAYDVASGGIEHVPFSSPSNLSRALEAARKSGIWILGASERAKQDVSQIDRDRPWLLVLGNEEKGLRRLTRQNCDALCKLSSRGCVSSLNVSVAAALLMATLLPD